MINVSDEIKQAYDLSTTQSDKIILEGKEYKITNVEYYDDCYEEGNIFGTAIARCLDFEVENTINLEGKEIEYLTGIQIDGVMQWISLGNFIVQDVTPNDTTNIAKVSAIDYMLKANITYKSKLNYSDGTVTLLDVLQEACDNSGLTLAITEFANKNFIVDSNQFVEGTLNRQVIQAVAQISGTVAKIRSDNKLYLLNPNNITSVSKVFTLNSYKEAEIKRATHPINTVSLGMSNIEGENVTLKDEVSVAKNGENTLKINDNPFAYSQSKREQLITALFNAVKGFEYKAYTFDCQGRQYLETIDKIQFLDKKGNTYDSYVFRFNYKSPNGLESTIEAPSIIKATVNYQNVLDAMEIAKRTEILVDKQNQTIEAVVSNADAQNEKISKVTQTVDELRSQISEVAEMTTSADGYGSVSLAGINESEPIRVVVRPVGEDIAYLYPRNNLYPSNDLYLKNRKLRFATSTYSIDWELPADLLYYDAENYDELILDYEGQSCVINKKVGYNANGIKYLLETPTTISYSYPKIPLEAGDYTVTLLGYTGAYLFVRLMAQNIYTTQFATKAEMNSAITQTVQEIDLSVNKKLTNYSTTSQMNSAINLKADSIISSINSTIETKLEDYSTTTQMNAAIELKADSIISSVSSTYETKENASNTYATQKQLTTVQSETKQTTDSISAEVTKKVNNSDYTKASIIAKINDTSSQVKINADVVDLSANDVLNLLSGNAINLTTKNISISSTNFSVDKNGNLKANNATLKGTIQAGSTISGATITGSTFKAGDNNEFYVDENGVLQCKVLKIIGEKNTSVTFYVYSEETGRKVQFTSESIILNNGSLSNSKVNISNDGTNGHIYCSGAIEARGSSGTVSADAAMYATNFINTSESKLKENIIKFVDKLKESVLNTKSATDILKETEICEFNYLGQQEKTIGVVIGDEYKTPKEIIKTKTEADGSQTKGVDLYSMVSLAWLSIQELVSRIENLERM